MITLLQKRLDIHPVGLRGLFLFKRSFTVVMDLIFVVIHGLNFRYRSPGKSSFGNIFLREEISPC